MIKQNNCPTIDFLGVKFQTKSSSELIFDILNSKHNSSQHIHLIAASTLVAALKNEHLLEKLNAGVNISDSAPISFLSRLHKKEILHIRGTDFMRETFRLDAGGTLHFLFGTTTENLAQLEQSLIGINKNAKIVGKISPSYTDSNEVLKEHLDEIRNSNASVVWVGLGSPKQDIVASQINRILGVNAIAVGAAFDFISGSKKEVPRWIRNTGLEWFFRLMMEPRRLWKRYLLGNLLFILHYFRYLLKANK
jgi:N-acetylglucosaminyldiphosphoundecaprenol N-acetyl-beta-D-mannosaminyltransferase